jgi:hypothetical protein
MNFLPLLEFHRIFSKGLDLLEKFLYVYDNYSIYRDFLHFSCSAIK